MNASSNFLIEAIDLDTIISRTVKLATSYVCGEICMFNIERGKYYNLNSIGSRVWELIESPQPVSNIIAVLLEEYDVEREICEENILEFLYNLYTEGIICIEEVGG